MPELATPQAVFFDLDGTLIDTAPDMGGALNRLLHRYGKPPVPAERYRSHVSHGSLALLRLGFPHLTDELQLHNLRDEFLHEYETGVAIASSLFDGMEQVLRMLETAMIPWGIITNKPEYLTLKLLDQLKLTDRCCCVVGADTAVRAKPHPEPMELACKLTDVLAEECIYLGDAERDIQAGRSVNMTTLIAGWGYIDSKTDKPDTWAADGYLSHPTHLTAYISE